MKIDPRSDAVALYYTGSAAGEPSISGVPARDLTENDIARLAYERALREYEPDAPDPGDPPDPTDPPARLVTAVLDELKASPLYRRTEPTNEPAPPAAEPEG